jgi:putative ABC transport system ATP-binding protein
MMTMDDAVLLEHVTKEYGRGAHAVAALSDVSLAISRGDFVSVMGPSGSGKSTFLNLVAGLDTPTAGRILVDGNDLAVLSDDARSDLRLEHVGMIFQSFNLFATFTAQENVMWPLEFLGKRRAEARVRAAVALDHVGIARAAWNRRPAELSGGEQQRLAIARALVTSPTLLLADEPTGNLDSRTGQVILDLLRQLNHAERLTVILVTHSSLAATYGDRTIELQDGRIIRDIRDREGGRVVPLRE